MNTNFPDKRTIEPNAQLTLVMPILNEGVRIIPVISTLFLTTKIQLLIIIVYDYDNDPTLQVIEDIKSQYPNIKTVKNEHKKLIGAIITGFKYCESDVVGIWLAYHVDPFGLLNDMYDLVKNHDCILVSGNRFNKIKRVSRGNAIKKLMSRAANFVLNRFIGVPLGDITTSIKLYRKSFLDNHPIDTTIAGGWALSIELTIKAAIEGCKLGDIEFKPENINLIQGVTNFKALKHLNQYFKWLYLGFINRAIIRRNYINPDNFICR